MAGFDENQPRDSGGRWTAGDAGGAIRSAASDTAKKVNEILSGNIVNYFKSIGESLGTTGSYTTADNIRSERQAIMADLDKKFNEIGLSVEQKLDAVEDIIRYQTFESMAAYDWRGNLISFNDGNEGQVQVNATRDQTNEGYMTHNHPRDQSFSNGDLNATVHYGFKEMRAVSAGHDFIFRPNYNYTIPETLDNIGENNTIIANQIAMQNAVWDEVRDTQQKMVSGQMDQEDGNGLFQHRVFQRFAKETGGKYSVEPKNPDLVTNKILLTQDIQESVFGEKAIAEERKAKRMIEADDVNIAMRRLRRELKKNM